MRTQVFLTLTLAAFGVAGCASSSGSGGTVTIPSNDSTYPLVLLDVVPTGGSLMTVTAHSLPITLHVGSNDSIAFIARAIDDDGGVQTVQIWKTVRRCKTAADLSTCSGPGLAIAPEAKNSDTKKSPGSLADTQRIIALTVDMHSLTPGNDFVEVKVWAVGANFSNLSERTQEITLQFP